MFNKTIIEFGCPMYQVSSSLVSMLPAQTYNSDLCFDNSWNHAQPHHIIAYCMCEFNLN